MQERAVIGTTESGDAYWFRTIGDAETWFEPMDASEAGDIWFDEMGNELQVEAIGEGWRGTVSFKDTGRRVPDEGIARLRTFLEEITGDPLEMLEFDGLVALMRSLYANRRGP